MTRLTLPDAHIATLLRALTRDRDQLAAAGDDAEAQAVQAVIYAVEPQVVVLHPVVMVGDVWRARNGDLGMEVTETTGTYAVFGDWACGLPVAPLTEHYVLIERDGVPVAQENTQ